MKTPIMSSVCIINKMCRKLFNYSLNYSFLIQIQIKLELYHRKRKIIFSCQVFFPRIYHGYFQETSVNKLRVVVFLPIRYIYVWDFSHTIRMFGIVQENYIKHNGLVPSAQHHATDISIPGIRKFLS